MDDVIAIPRRDLERVLELVREEQPGGPVTKGPRRLFPDDERLVDELERHARRSPPLT